MQSMQDSAGHLVGTEWVLAIISKCYEGYRWINETMV